MTLLDIHVFRQSSAPPSDALAPIFASHRFRIRHGLLLSISIASAFTSHHFRIPLLPTAHMLTCSHAHICTSHRAGRNPRSCSRGAADGDRGTHLRSLLLRDLGTGVRYCMSCSFCTHRLHLSGCIIVSSFVRLHLSRCVCLSASSFYMHTHKLTPGHQRVEGSGGL